MLRRVWLISLGFLTLSGCARSLQPVYTPKDIVFDLRYLGSWTDGKETWTVTRLGLDRYQIAEGDKPAEVKATLVRLGTDLLVDLEPVDEQDGLTVAAHTIAWLRVDGEGLNLRFLSDKWLQKALASGPAAIAHIKVAANILLTAAPRDLQAFLKTHAANADAYETLRLRRTGSAP